MAARVSTGQSIARSSRNPSPASAGSAAAAPAPPPPAWRDPWAWLTALSVLPLVLHSLGAALGEPVAEDFDFLRHTLLLKQHSLLDGGGSQAFWRPVAHQLYYGALGPMILDHPRWVAALHAALLALAAVLIYRALRPVWSGPQAAAAASFALLAESTRTVFSWPSHGVELGSLLFAALALHEASRRRMATCLVALLLSLLSKELGVVAALLIPFMPDVRGPQVAGAPIDLRSRMRWAVATGLVTGAWALTYLWVRRTAGLALPHGLETDAATLAVPFASRYAWAAWNSLRAVVSLAAAPAPRDLALGAAATLPIAAALVIIATRGDARARARRALPWIAWGAAWFALSTAALTTIYPIWAPNRVLFGSVGLGISLVALLAAVHPLLPLLLVVARLAAFSLSPGPTLVVLPEAARSGAFMDFAQLTRLQRLMADTRQALVARYPALPRDARVGQHNMPRQAEYAFGGDHAPQVWYRDTTLRWVRFEDYSRDTAIRLVTIAEYQLGHVPVVALVEPAAMRNLVLASGQMAANDLAAALHSLAAAESLQRDPAARVFVATVVAKRAICLLGQGHGDAARGEAGRALARLPESVDARYVLAATGVERGEWAEASAQLDTLLAISPDDGDAKVLRERIRQGRAAGK